MPPPCGRWSVTFVAAAAPRNRSPAVAIRELASSVAELKEFPNITYQLGGHRLEDFKDRDMIIKAAGVPLDSPFIAEAKKNHIPVRMSADLFAELAGVPVSTIRTWVKNAREAAA